MSRENVAEQTPGNRLTNVAEMRRPAAIQIDGQFHARLPGLIDQTPADIEIEHERLLAEDVFPRIDRPGNQPDALFGMRGDIDNFDVIATKNLSWIGVRLRLRKEFGPAGLSALNVPIAQRDDIQLHFPIRGEMVCRNPAASDQRDQRIILSRPRRFVRKQRRGNRIVSAGGHVVVGFFCHAITTLLTLSRLRGRGNSFVGPALADA